MTDRENQEKSTLKLVFHDTFNDCRVKFNTTLNGDGLEAFYEAFESFLLAVGFMQDSINRRYEE